MTTDNLAVNLWTAHFPLETQANSLSLFLTLCNELLSKALTLLLLTTKFNTYYHGKSHCLKQPLPNGFHIHFAPGLIQPCLIPVQKTEKKVPCLQSVCIFCSVHARKM